VYPVVLKVESTCAAVVINGKKIFSLFQEKKEKGLATMKELLRQKTYQGALSKVSSPLDPSYTLRHLK